MRRRRPDGSSIQYCIRPYPGASSALCGDNTFVTGYCCLSKRKSTRLWLHKGNAQNALVKLQRRFKVPHAVVEECGG